MSRKLQLRRGIKATLPTLNMGELGFCTDTKELYIGTNFVNISVNPLVLLNGFNGMLVKTGTDEFDIRTIQGNNGVLLSNGDGVTGDPIITPDYGSVTNTVCEGNDPRLLSGSQLCYLQNKIEDEPDCGVTSLHNNKEMVNILTSDTGTSFAMGYTVRNFADNNPALDPSIYASVVTEHCQYAFDISLSGEVDSLNYEVEWSTFYEGGDIQIGNESISNASDTVSVVFDTAFANANYSIMYCIRNTVDTTTAFYGDIMIAKTTTGFTVKLSSAVDSANYELVWVAQPATSDLQTGTQSISNGVDNISITIPTTYDDTNYINILQMVNTVDSSPSQYGMVVTDKTKNSFKVEFSGVMDSANYKLIWTTHELEVLEIGALIDCGSFV